MGKTTPAQAATRGESRRYYQVSNILMQRIEEGVYKLGELLPTEVELCEEFEISRYTVREALRRLIEAGLVTRRQGSGTQIIATQKYTNYAHTMRSLSELFEYASDTVISFDLIEERLPAPELARHFGDRAEESWLYMEGVRTDREGKRPICFTRVFIDTRFNGIVGELQSHGSAIYALIEDRYKINVDDVEQEIRALPITKAAAKKLDVPQREYAVQMVRRYVSSEGKLILVSISDHPSSRFSYTMHLRREGMKGSS
ncbi:GntR family transcriptional regulator [Oceanibacterium hippocampi]|uniref:HTH-type transcriptional regulator FrlR n=1 Tax=Oceanibacterium hippocampi TaxID=745714 RepID=A0A1Y5TZK1_9PROT|nr:GntR family transcriptional regulator [Oceanibacterium hippocampi]SLN75360.1 HTH-type transcriptional regulator FrlR [Oceanibacterium hippocampi]